MKTNRLLVTLLLVTLCAGFYSCEKELDRQPVSSIDPSTPSNTTDEIFANYIKEYSNIKCRGYLKRESTIILSGIKNKHLWFSEFDISTKNQKMTWEDLEETDTIQKLYKGYGEYEILHVKYAIPNYYKQTSSGSIVTFDIGRRQTIFTSNKKSKRTQLQNNSTGIANDWYSESVFIGDCCYSYEGDTIYVAKEKPNFENGKMEGTELISYEEGIKIEGGSFSKYNYKSAQFIWIRNISAFLEVPYDSKFSYTRLDNSTNIWKYKVDVTYYDGTKKDFTFYLNIENGNIADNLNSLPLCGEWRYYDMNSKTSRYISFVFGGKGSWRIFYTNNETSISKQFTYTFDGKDELIINWEDNKTEIYPILITDTYLRITNKDGVFEFYQRN
jgi:hypothetical protein